MKKIITLILILALFPAFSAKAASGDIAGNVYSTDIITYMYYAPITSYNIGGKTCIDAEILNWHYGFDVYWYEDTRHLDITDKGGRFVSLQAMSGEIVESSTAEPGKIVGKYYETDILTTLNGEEIESYNIGGRTMICAEAMASFGYIVDWNEESRTLTISKPSDFYQYSTDYGDLRSIYDFKLPRQSLVFLNRGILVTKDEKEYVLDTPSNKIYGSPGGVTYIKLSDLTSILGGTCEMTESKRTSVSEWVNGITDSYDYYACTFNLSYDTSIQPEIREYNPDTYAVTRSDITGEGCYALDLSSVASLTVNGEPYEIKAFYGGKEFSGYLKVIEGEVYIPAYNVSRLLGYDFSW